MKQDLIFKDHNNAKKLVKSAKNYLLISNNIIIYTRTVRRRLNEADILAGNKQKKNNNLRDRDGQITVLTLFSTITIITFQKL